MTEFATLAPLPGGWSGETFVAEAAGERTVLRLYANPRRPAPAEVDAAVLRLVRGLVPVPTVLDVRRAADDHPAMLITSFEPGRRADTLDLPPDRRRRLGANLGEILADLAGMPMVRPGPFLNGDLTIGRFPDGGLPEFVAATPPPGFDADQLATMEALAGEAQAELDRTARACLVHSDFNLKNLLVDPDTLDVTAVLDWEFTHAGHPFTDLGNLLRFERDEEFTGGVLDAWCRRRGGSPAGALHTARCADLFALVELASRAGANPATEAAHRLLAAIATTGDVQAMADADPAGWTSSRPHA